MSRADAPKPITKTVTTDDTNPRTDLLSPNSFNEKDEVEKKKKKTWS